MQAQMQNMRGLFKHATATYATVKSQMLDAESMQNTERSKAHFANAACTNAQIPMPMPTNK